MAEKNKKTNEKENMNEVKTSGACSDIKCPIHGELAPRGRKFEGVVTRKFPKRVVIEFERTIYIRKYERYAKAKTKLHAWLPQCLSDSINIGDYIEISECRPLSKIISFVAIRKIRSREEKKTQ